MKDNFQRDENFVNAQSYYPKSITLGQNSNAQTMHEQNFSNHFSNEQNNNFSQPSWQNNPSPFEQNLNGENSSQNQGGQSMQSMLSNLFSSNNPLLSQFFSGNPLLSMLFSGKSPSNQNELMTNLLGSLMKNQESKDKDEKVIEIKNSIEEF